MTGHRCSPASNRDPALAAKMLEDYLAGSAKTEEAPAFVAHDRLAQLKQQLGRPGGGKSGTGSGPGPGA